MDLNGRTIVVTGGSAGLGAAMARWFTGQGAAVGVCARRRPAEPGRMSVAAAVDVTDLKALEAFGRQVSSELGPIDLWINNAAVIDPIVLQRRLGWDEMARHFNINVGGVLNGTQVFLSELEKHHHRGVLVNISSGLASKGRAGLSAYSAAKAAVERLTEVVGLEEKELLDQALAVAPGVIETAMQETLRSQDETVLHDVDMFRELDTDGKMYRPEWIAMNIARWAFEAPPPSPLVRVPAEK